jgi:putative addiction module component (TIGR02574 family)
MSMGTRVDDVLSKALELDPEERAELAGRLLDSLRTADSAVDGAWKAEIRSRMEQLDSGAVGSIAWEEARGRIFRLPDADSPGYWRRRAE